MPRRIDTGVFEKIQSFDDYRKANEEFQRKRMIDATDQKMEQNKYQQGLQEFEFRKQNAAEQNAIQRQAIEALAPQRQLAIESGQFELGQARRSQQMQDEILQQMQQPQPQAQQGGGVLRPDVQEINNQMQGMSGASPATTQDAPASPEQMRLAIARMAVVNPAAANAMRAAMLPSTGGGSTPAAIQIANEIQAALDSGNIERANLLMQVQKTVDRGVNPYGENGASPMSGYGSAVASIGQAREAGEAQGSNFGKEQGVAQGNLANLEANMPKLEALTVQLEDLADKATYTMAGRAYNEVLRQIGQPVPDSAVARAEYQSLIDNNILPLLRQTFGAQFTQKEGESLKATLGDVNLSPSERKAVLTSFIEQKRNEVESLQRQVGGGMAAAPQNVQQQPAGGSTGGWSIEEVR